MIMHRFVFIKSICYGYFLSKLSVTLVHLFYICKWTRFILWPFHNNDWKMAITLKHWWIKNDKWITMNDQWKSFGNFCLVWKKFVFKLNILLLFIYWMWIGFRFSFSFSHCFEIYITFYYYIIMNIVCRYIIYDNEIVVDWTSVHFFINIHFVSVCVFGMCIWNDRYITTFHHLNSHIFFLLLSLFRSQTIYLSIIVNHTQHDHYELMRKKNLNHTFIEKSVWYAF